MNGFLYTMKDIFSIFGYLIRLVGFLLVGLGLGRFFLANYPKSNWQLQMALALGLFGLIIALTVYSSAGSAGAFALGAGIAFLNVQKEEAPEAEAALVEEPKKKK